MQWVHYDPPTPPKQLHLVLPDSMYAQKKSLSAE